MTFGTFASGETVESLVRRALPDRAQKGEIDTAPINPADVFAVSGLLLQLSGAYHHIQSDQDGHLGAPRRVLQVDDAFHVEAAKLAKTWAKLNLRSTAAPSGVQALWTKLLADHGAESVFDEMEATDPCPEWWVVALKLFIAADDAVVDEVGWLPAASLKTPWGFAVSNVVTVEAEQKRGYLHTIAFETNPDLANVLPKSRTPTVGCTLRSLSHNLALLPPRGVARAYWIGPQDMPLEDPVALNLLIVPYPYKLFARSFTRGSTGDQVESRNWGWFDVDQGWLDQLAPTDLTDWVMELIKAARLDCDTVHGVIFPELAMRSEHFNRLVQELEGEDGIELVISGLSDNGKGRTGNFVATRMMNSKAYRVQEGVTRVREKHHRWRMDSSQIGNYALSSSLPPPAAWWEQLDILSRSLDVFVFRKDSALTTLICEDLARVDPCQELVRSIGPNLVVALLMDSAQIKDRWPARYATVLAEDPGCSVLTLTSRALVDRSNQEGAWDASNAIALWRDDSGKVRSIEAKPDADAVLLTLAGERHHERSLDGRVSSQKAVSWRYHGQQPVKAEEAGEKLRARIWSRV